MQSQTVVSSKEGSKAVQASQVVGTVPDTQAEEPLSDDSNQEEKDEATSDDGNPCRLWRRMTVLWTLLWKLLWTSLQSQ